MNQFYVSPEQVQGDELVLTEEESRHAVASLRIRPGDTLHATDGCGNRYKGIVREATPKRMEVQISERVLVPPVKPAIHVVLGALKSRERLEFAVEKCAEMGAASIIICKMDHCERGNVRIDRLHSICVSALKQSLGAYLTRVDESSSLLKALERQEFQGEGAALWMADETVDATEGGATVGGVTVEGSTDGATTSSPSAIVWLIGPEGGFSEKEREAIAAISDREVRRVSLGSTRLRAETAAIAAVSRTSFL